MRRIGFAISLLLLCYSVYASAQGFTLTSKDLGGQITKRQVYSGFGCTGDNISPSLKWVNPPKGTKSFAVTVYDPDAPTGSGWWHWVIFNIPAKATGLKQDAGRIEKKLAPAGSVQSVTDYGKPGFGGPCPPEGDEAHQYIFTVYALKVAKLVFDSKTNPAMVGFVLNSNALAKASLVAYYKR